MTFLRSTIAAFAVLTLAGGVFAASHTAAIGQTASEPAEAAPFAPAGPADPTDPTGPADPVATTPAGIEVELNKLEDLDGLCRAYFIIRNATERPIETLELEIYLLDPDDIVNQRFALAFNAIRAGRTKVALFEFETECSAIGRMLVNDLYTCDAPDGPIAGCADRLATTQRADVPLEY